MHFEVALLNAEQLPLYQQIGEKTFHLKKLGMNNEAIARHLRVDGKTIAKALRWMNGKMQL